MPTSVQAKEIAIPSSQIATSTPQRKPRSSRRRPAFPCALVMRCRTGAEPAKGSRSGSPPSPWAARQSAQSAGPERPASCQSRWPHARRHSPRQRSASSPPAARASACSSRPP
eukprot:3952323-Pleurochrysis_carterae.AAC.2